MGDIMEGLRGSISIVADLNSALSSLVVMEAGLTAQATLIGTINRISTAGTSLFAQAFEDDLDAVFFNEDEGSIRALYNGYTGILVNVVADHPIMQDPGTAKDMKIIEVRVKDIPSPRANNTFAIDGDNWYLLAVISGGPSEGIWTIQLTRSPWRQV